MEARDLQLVISAANHPRLAWNRAFAAMVARGDDKLLDRSAPTTWDETEWEW
jgi:hypothetical protein